MRFAQTLAGLKSPRYAAPTKTLEYAVQGVVRATVTQVSGPVLVKLWVR